MTEMGDYRMNVMEETNSFLTTSTISIQLYDAA